MRLYDNIFFEVLEILMIYIRITKANVIFHFI